MSWMDKRRQAFNPKGPYLAKRAGAAGDLTLKYGKTYTREELHAGNVTDRIIERMYSGYWFDMAPEADANPLSPEETAALAANGVTIAEWLVLSKSARATALRRAMAKAKDEQAAGAPETAQGAPEAPVEGETPPEPVETAPSAPAALAAYRHAGFGKWYAIDAAGNNIGAALSKATAAGFAARDNVPLLGQKDALPGAAG